MKENNSMASAVFWSYIDKITTKGLTALVSIVLARLVAPEHYGIIAIASIFVVVFDIFVDPGMTSSLIQEKDSDSLDFSTIFVFNTIVSAFLYIVLFLIAPSIAALYDEPSLSTILRCMALKIPLAGINSVQLAFVQKNMLFKRYCFISFFGTFGGAVLAIIMAIKGYGVWALVTNFLFDGFFDVILTLLFTDWKPQFKFSMTRFKRMFGFSGSMLAVKFIDMLYVELSEFLVGYKYSSSDLAFFDKGKKFPQMIVSNANTALGNVLFPSFASIQDDNEILKDSIRKATQLTSYIMFPILVGLAVCSDSLINVLLTEKWAFTAPYMKVMCIYFLWLPYSNVVLQGFKAKGRGKTIFKLETVKKIYGVLLIVLAIVLFDSPIYVAVSFAITSSVALFLDSFVANRVLEYKYKEIILDLLPPLLASIVMGVCVYLLYYLNLSCLITLLLQLLVGVLVYLIISFVFRFKSFRFVIEFARDFCKKRR